MFTTRIYCQVKPINKKFKRKRGIHALKRKPPLRFRSIQLNFVTAIQIWALLASITYLFFIYSPLVNKYVGKAIMIMKVLFTIKALYNIYNKLLCTNTNNIKPNIPTITNFARHCKTIHKSIHKKASMLYASAVSRNLRTDVWWNSI